MNGPKHHKTARNGTAVEGHHWDPPRWLVWYGYSMAAAWGAPAQMPTRNPLERALASFRPSKVDEEVRRLITEPADR